MKPWQLDELRRGLERRRDALLDELKRDAARLREERADDIGDASARMCLSTSTRPMAARGYYLRPMPR